MLQVPSGSIPYLTQIQQAVLVVAVVVSLVAARRVSDSDRSWGAILRRRFVLGVPWGTALTILGVLSAYWFLQGGWAHPHNPVVVAFRSWSYFYPLGLLSAAFTHTGIGHLLGNLVGTVVFAPIVEYAWGHYPTRRGSETFTGPGTNPFVRILAVPAVVAVVGLLTSMFTVGPVIGFSGVVFAFMGFAFVTRPKVAIVALVSSDVVGLLVRSLRTPDITAQSQPRFITPWFADVAVQGHALGLLLGVALGIALLRRRDVRPDALSVWLAAVVVTVSESLWAIYVPVGADEFWLFRAVGLGLMFALAALVVTAIRASDEPLVARIDLGRREAAMGLFFALLLATGAAAVPFNLATIEGTPSVDDRRTVEVRDYTVVYVEGAVNQYVSVINFSRFGGATTVRSSGVVVYSEQRRVWLEAISKGQLAFRGFGSVTLGGLGWRETVFARRIGWSVVGNGSTYKVYLRREGKDRRLAFVAEPVLARPVVDNRSFQFVPLRSGFGVRVLRNNVTLGRSRLPRPGNQTVVGGVTLNRTNGNIYALRNGTRVKIASKEVPQARQND